MTDDPQPGGVSSRSERLASAFKNKARSGDFRVAAIEVGGTALGAILLGIGGGVVGGNALVGGILLFFGGMFTFISVAFVVARQPGALEFANDALAATHEAEARKAEAETERLRAREIVRSAEAACSAREAAIQQKLDATNARLHDVHLLSEKRNRCLLVEGSLRELTERFILRSESERRLPAAFNTLLLTIRSGRTLEAFGCVEPVRWTISIFQRFPGENGGPEEIRRIHVLRSNGNDDPAGRSWCLGEGYSGLAWEQGRPLVLPDTQVKDGKLTIIRPPEKVKASDDELYRSVAAIPVRLGASREVWGVVSATSDQVGHFDTAESRPFGQLHQDAMRSLAGFVSLLVAGATA